jgi:hypothetical protein
MSLWVTGNHSEQPVLKHFFTWKTSQFVCKWRHKMTRNFIPETNGIKWGLHMVIPICWLFYDLIATKASSTLNTFPIYAFTLTAKMLLVSMQKLCRDDALIYPSQSGAINSANRQNRHKSVCYELLSVSQCQLQSAAKWQGNHAKVKLHRREEHDLRYWLLIDEPTNLRAPSWKHCQESN